MINSLLAEKKKRSRQRTHASAASPLLALNAEPPLKPNQPKFKSAEPSSTNGTLCAREVVNVLDERCPTTSEATSAEKPDAMCTTLPPVLAGK